MNVPAHIMADVFMLLEDRERYPLQEQVVSIVDACARLRAFFDAAQASTEPAPPYPAAEAIRIDPDRLAWRADWPEDWPGCVTAGCREPASFSFNWPGKGRLCACFSCAVRVLNVGDACGLDAKALELVYLPAVKP